MRTLVSIDARALPGHDGEDLDMLADSLADLIRVGHEIVVTYGGAAGSAAASGSRLVRALSDALPGRSVAAVLTHTEVRAHDPVLEEAEAAEEEAADPAKRRRAQRMRAQEDGGPPPLPLHPYAVLEAPVVRELLDCGTVVVCAPGGPPVLREPGSGRLRQAPAAVTVDPQRTAVMLAAYLDADVLLFLGADTHLFSPRSHGHPRPLLRLTPQHISAVQLAAESRGTAEAAADFVERTGGLAGVGPVTNALGILRESTGTLISPAPEAVAPA